MSGLDPRRRVGQEGETAAEQYLRKKGYKIVGRNLRSSLGEMDLVAEDGPVLVFVEVKARRTDEFGGAVEAIHEQKRKKLIQLASQYLARYHWTNRPCRFDVVLLQSAEGGAQDLEHIENAFDVPGDDHRW